VEVAVGLGRKACLDRAAEAAGGVVGLNEITNKTGWPGRFDPVDRHTPQYSFGGGGCSIGWRANGVRLIEEEDAMATVPVRMTKLHGSIFSSNDEPEGIQLAVYFEMQR